MVDIAGNLENQAVTLAPDAQSLATQAFQTAVAPLREGSQERLTGTLESLSQRGIQFGELGTENVQDLLERESKKEAQLASEIGTSFGKTQLEQAFAASEAAKNRTLQTELTEKGFEFEATEGGLFRTHQTGERLGSQEFAGEQAGEAREFAAGEAALGREFSSTEADIARAWTGDQAELTRNFQEQENALGRTFSSSESQLQRDFGLDTQEAAQIFQSRENALGRTFTEEENVRARDFASTETEKGRDFQSIEADIARQFQAEENLLGRTFSAEETALQRDFQQTFADNQNLFQADQASIDRQRQDNQTAISLALQGNLDPASIGDVLSQTFGEGATLTTNDEADLQRAATASGLSTDQYLAMRQAIGEGQLNAVLAHPEDFIDNPETARQFQINMAQMSIDAAIEGARITAGATTDAARQAAQASRDESLFETVGTVVANNTDILSNVVDAGVETGGNIIDAVAATAETRPTDLANNLGAAAGQAVFGDIGGAVGGAVDSVLDFLTPSCNLATVAYEAGLLTKKELMDFPKYRVKVQSKEKNGDMVWAGYIEFSKPIAKLMKKHLWLNKLITKYVTKPWHSYIKSPDTCSIRSRCVEKALRLCSLSTYKLKRLQCDNTLKQYEGKNTVWIYKQIIKGVTANG